MRLHGVPSSIVSDRDFKFMWHFWRTLWRKMGNELKYSNAYLPQIDGQTESINRRLGNFLRCLVGNHVKTWDLVIPQAEFAYINSINRSIKKTPFKAACGLKPQHVLDLVSLPPEARVSNDSEAFSDQIRRVHEEVGKALKASNQSYATAANEHHKIKEFEEGDLVLVHLKIERLSRGKYHKLKSGKFGTCKILKKNSSNAYFIVLPSE